MPEERPTYDEKLELILRTAAAIFADKGYHQASIRDISKETGISLSGLYYYFESKEELLYLIQSHCFETVLGEAERLLANVSDPARRLRVFVENHLRYFVANMKEMKVLSHEAESLTGEYRRIVSAKKKRYTELCMGILEALKGPGPGPNVRVATYALFGMMNWIYNWYRPERDVPVEVLAAEMTELFLRGYLGGGWAKDRAAAPSPAGAEASHSIWRR